MSIGIEDLKGRSALNRVLNYNGLNQYILDIKRKANKGKYALTSSQVEYVETFADSIPVPINKIVEITEYLGESLKTKYELTFIPNKIEVKEIIADKDKSYHVIGRIKQNQPPFIFWIPKTQIITDLYGDNDCEFTLDVSKYSERQPYDYQVEGIKKLYCNDRFILADDMGLGKAVPVNTLIYTPYGTTKIGDLNINDKVIGSDGKPYNVTGIYPQGTKDIYKITFNDGYSILCSDEHLWSVSSSNYGKNTNNSRIKKSLVLSTKQMSDKDCDIIVSGDSYNYSKKYRIKTHYKQPNGNLKWQIPIVKPIEFYNDDDVLPIDPYLLGIYLGDGHFLNRAVTISLLESDFDEIFNGIETNRARSCNKIKTLYINLNDRLVNLKLNNHKSHNKFIPNIYKYSSIENRLAILQGLMDTDGHCMYKKNNKNFLGTEFCTVSEQLCDDVAEIVHTLGGICRKSSRIPTYTYKGEKKQGQRAYRLNVKLPHGMNPFRLKRKAEKYLPPQKYPTGRYIKNIEKLNYKEESVCISVDSPDKLYVIEHAIVTHNTTQATIAALELGAKKVLIICTATLKNNWVREINHYTDDVSVATTSDWNPKRFTIINYDILDRFHELKNENTYLTNEKFDLLILDECHAIKNSKSKRSKLVLDLAKYVKKIWMLTGTPIANRPIDYYNLLKLCDAPITSNWVYFIRRYCNARQFTIKKGLKKFKIWDTKGASNIDELYTRTKKHMLRRLKEDILDLPDKIITPIYLGIDKTEYDKTFDDYLNWAKTEGRELSAGVHLVKLTVLRKFIAEQKVKHTITLIEDALEQDKKVIVFTNFTNVIHDLKDHFGKISVVLYGATSMEDRQKAIDDFQNKKNIKVFIGNLKAAGVGITLTEAEMVIMNDLGWNPSDHSQGEDRAYRIGTKHKVNVLYPLFDDTIDIDIYNLLQRKKAISDIILGEEVEQEIMETFIKELLKTKS